MTYLSLVVFTCALIFFFLKSKVFDVKKWQITDHHRTIKNVMAQIPQDAALSAEIKLAVHTAERRELYAFNDNVGKVDYILYDFYAPRVNIITRKTFQLPFVWPDNEIIRSVLNDSSYSIVEYQDGVCLFKKDAVYQAGLKKLALASETEITHRLDREIGSNIYCSGYNRHEMLSYFYELERLGEIAWKKALHVTVYWKSALDSPGKLEWLLKIKREDQEVFKPHRPVFGLYPTTEWKANAVIRDEIFWELPDNIKPEVYELAVSLSGNGEQGSFVPLLDVEIK